MIAPRSDLLPDAGEAGLMDAARSAHRARRPSSEALLPTRGSIRYGARFASCATETREVLGMPGTGIPEKGLLSHHPAATSGTATCRCCRRTADQSASSEQVLGLASIHRSVVAMQQLSANVRAGSSQAARKRYLVEVQNGDETRAESGPSWTTTIGRLLVLANGRSRASQLASRLVPSGIASHARISAADNAIRPLTDSVPCLAAAQSDASPALGSLAAREVGAAQIA